MAHEHLLKAHIYLHTASGDTPALEDRRLRSHISKLVTSRRFQKWCSSGVVSAFLLCKTIDFTGFWGLFKILPWQMKSILTIYSKLLFNLLFQVSTSLKINVILRDVFVNNLVNALYISLKNFSSDFVSSPLHIR